MILVWIFRAVALACVALGVFALLGGYVIQGVTMLINAGTFTILGLTAKRQHQTDVYLEDRKSREFNG